MFNIFIITFNQFDSTNFSQLFGYGLQDESGGYIILMYFYATIINNKNKYFCYKN